MKKIANPPEASGEYPAKYPVITAATMKIAIRRGVIMRHVLRP